MFVAPWPRFVPHLYLLAGVAFATSVASGKDTLELGSWEVCKFSVNALREAERVLTVPDDWSIVKLAHIPICCQRSKC